MLGIITKYLPILIFAAYVNEAYRTENLIKVFGREYVFRFVGSGPKPVLVGGVFWFIVSILLIYLKNIQQSHVQTKPDRFMK